MHRERILPSPVSAGATPRAPGRDRRAALGAALARVSGVLLGAAAAWYWIRIWTEALPAFPGRDIRQYLEATRRWIDTGTPYLANEVAAPFAYSELTFLHPPIALPLFAPFLVLPLVLWWAIPAAILVAFVWWCRPAPSAWPLIGFALLWHHTGVAVVAGNSDLWVAASIAAGLPLAWPLVFVVIKPSLFVFGLLRANRRSWWIAAAAVGAVSVLFGSLWVDWVRVVLHGPGSLVYSLTSVPLMLLPVVAWIARRRPGETPLLVSPPATEPAA